MELTGVEISMVDSPASTDWSELDLLLSPAAPRSTNWLAPPETKSGQAQSQTCFRITKAMLEDVNYRVKFQVDLKEVYFVHTVLLVEDWA